MPSQQTICQQCGVYVPTAEMPLHVAEHFAVGARDLFERVALTSEADCSFRLMRFRNAVGDEHAIPNTPLPCHESAERPGACVYCGNAFSTHAVAPTQQTSEFAGPYAERGDAIAELLDAVSSGARLAIHGPSLTDDRTGASIQSAAGRRHVQASGHAIGPVLVELARKWKDSKR